MTFGGPTLQAAQFTYRNVPSDEVTTPEVVLGTSDAVAPWSLQEIGNTLGKIIQTGGKTYGSMEKSWNTDMFFIEPWFTYIMEQNIWFTYGSMEHIYHIVFETQRISPLQVLPTFFQLMFFFFTTSMRGRNQLIDRGHHLVDTLDSSQMGIETNRIFRDRL